MVSTMLTMWTRSALSQRPHDYGPREWCSFFKAGCLTIIALSGHRLDNSHIIHTIHTTKRRRQRIAQQLHITLILACNHPPSSCSIQLP